MNLKVKSKKINDFTYELAISAKWEDILVKNITLWLFKKKN